MVILVGLAVVFVISLLGLTGGILLIYRQQWAKLISKYLITFAVGALLGAVFLDLLPEAIKELGVAENALVYSLLGIIVFYLLEKTLFWYHHHSIEQVWHRTHTREEKAHPVGIMIILGDALHNFIDGLAIAASFLFDFKLGITTSLAVLFHELPEEIGIFAVLLHAKFGRYKTILLSALAQMTAVLGALVGFLALPLFANSKGILLAFAAGNFIYIASTDLLPETHREKDIGKSLIQVGLLVLGILVIWFTAQIFPE